MSVYTVPRYLRVYEPARGDLRWQDAALCAEVGGDEWFPEDGGHAEPAKRVCRSCSVRVPCLKFALENPQLEGVWGGFSGPGRIEAARQLAAGRSLEDIIADDDAAAYARQDRSAEVAEAAKARQLARQKEKRAAIASPSTPQSREAAA